MKTPYRARIVEYCQRNGIVVPANFDVAQDASKLVLVDFSSSPPVLFPHSTHQWKELLKWGSELIAQGKVVRYFDFKRKCELVKNDEGKLVRAHSISALSAEEQRQLEWRHRSEA